ncbi:MAG: type II toxin-antitoxin system VapC family toxin [Gammaproteobacteria bacterium]|nr:MAG: type II toxin-antitoxin system VapC family toxin [Gammaproteobacteria bacterium]
MRVVDTSAWIEWLVASPLSAKLKSRMPAREQCLVPTLVQLELAKWMCREMGEDRSDQVIAFTQKCIVVPLDTSIALRAADLHRVYKLATADAVIYASALEHSAELLTCDAHFEGLPGVELVRKT